MYLSRYIRIIYTHTLSKTHLYVRMYNTLQESHLDNQEARLCCCSKNMRYQIRGATHIAVLEKQERTGNMQNQKQGGENKTQNYEKRK